MKDVASVLATIVLTAVAFAGITIGLNVAAESAMLSRELITNGLILGGLLAGAAWVVTAVFRRSSRNPLCYSFAMAFVNIVALAVMLKGSLVNESLIAYGAIAVVAFFSGLLGSGASRLLFGPPAAVPPSQ
jgi:hypothetical protein